MSSHPHLPGHTRFLDVSPATLDISPLTQKKKPSPSAPPSPPLPQSAADQTAAGQTITRLLWPLLSPAFASLNLLKLNSSVYYSSMLPVYSIT